jgi:hypothetical protein
VIEGSCHCGAVRLTLAAAPASVAECNCSLCRRIAGLWHHGPPADVTVTGDPVGYVQGDRTLTTWHCGTCGCTTHWTPTDPDYPQMAVNMRLFDPEVWSALPKRQIDGASF